MDSTSSLNENSTIEETNSSHCHNVTHDELSKIDTCTFWVEGVSMAVLGVLALITNAITIYVFSRKEMRNSFNSLIVVLTVIDSILCILLVADYSFARAFALGTVAHTLLYPHLIYPMINFTLSASIYMTVILGLERYIAVCYPIVHRDLVHTYSVAKRVFAYTGPVLLVSFLINIPKFLETKVVVVTQPDHEDLNQNETSSDRIVANVSFYSIDVTELRDDPVYIKYYMNVTRTVLLGILPFTALIFFNIKIYMRFLVTRGRYARPNSHNSSQAKDLQLALLLVFIVCMFFVTNLPRLLLNLYELFNVDDMIACGNQFVPPVWFLCATTVNHLLLILNCIMNFVVYCCFNDGFKRLLCGLIGKQLRLQTEVENSSMAASWKSGGPTNQQQPGNQRLFIVSSTNPKAEKITTQLATSQQVPKLETGNGLRISNGRAASYSLVAADCPNNNVQVNEIISVNLENTSPATVQSSISDQVVVVVVKSQKGVSIVEPCKVIDESSTISHDGSEVTKTTEF